MSYESIVKLMQSRFEDEVRPSLTDDVMLVYDNLDDGLESQLKQDDPFIHITINFGSERQVTLGAAARTFRTTGVLTANVFVRAGRGKETAYEIADVITSKFRAVKANGVRYLDPNVQRVGRSGKWWQLNVNCPFQFDETF